MSGYSKEQQEAASSAVCPRAQPSTKYSILKISSILIFIFAVLVPFSSFKVMFRVLYKFLVHTFFNPIARDKVLLMHTAAPEAVIGKS